jgi:hypothetical protein
VHCWENLRPIPDPQMTRHRIQCLELCVIMRSLSRRRTRAWPHLDRRGGSAFPPCTLSSIFFLKQLEKAQHRFSKHDAFLVICLACANRVRGKPVFDECAFTNHTQKTRCASGVCKLNAASNSFESHSGAAASEGGGGGVCDATRNSIRQKTNALQIFVYRVDNDRWSAKARGAVHVDGCVICEES